MIYLYQSPEGKVVERRYSIRDDIPTTIIEDGVECSRLYTAPQIHWNAPGFTQRAEDRLTRWQRENLEKY